MKVFSQRPNRFNSASVVRVNALWSSWVVGCLMNLVFIAVVLGFVAVFWLLSWRGGVAASSVSIATVPPLPSPVLVTATSLPTLIPVSTATQVPTSTPLPTATPFPTVTPFPTSTPLPTATPFTLTISFPTAVPTPVPMYSYSDLESGAASVQVVSNYPYGFYRALCVEPDKAFIQPRVVGVPEKVGLVWRLWNDFGYKDELDHSKDVTFFLSDDSSKFHLALFWYDDQISDQIDVDYPGSCRSTQIIFVQARPPLAQNVSLSSVLSVTVH